MSPEQVACRIIKENRYMTLATTDGHTAWASAVAYVRDTGLNLYWYSAVDARHSKNIEHQPIIAVAIFNSTEPSSIVDGVQIQGTASMVTGDDLDWVMPLYFQQSFPDENERREWLRPRSDFEGNAIQRFYRFTPQELYKIDTDITKVDRRLSVDLDSVRAMLNADTL